MNLYSVTAETNDDSSGYIRDFIVADSEDEAENKWLNKYRGSGYDKKHITATLIEVEGYAIHATPVKRQESSAYTKG